MTDRDDEHMSRRDWLAGSALLITGLAVSAFAVPQILTTPVVMAQAVDSTKPPATTAPVGKENGPADSMPGGTRPTTPAPEPARPNQNGTVGSGPPAPQDRPPVTGNPLPPAPAGQHGEPIRPK